MNVTTGTSLQRVERENGGVQAVSEFVSRVAEPLNVFGGPCLRGQARVFRDGFGNRGVETTVESMEFFYRDGGSLLDRERRDRLADVAIVMDDLGHGKTRSEQVPSVARGGRTYGVGGKGCGRRLQTKRLGQLRQ
jgi:hypothetical protein